MTLVSSTPRILIIAFLFCVSLDGIAATQVENRELTANDILLLARLIKRKSSSNNAELMTPTARAALLRPGTLGGYAVPSNSAAAAAMAMMNKARQHRKPERYIASSTVNANANNNMNNNGPLATTTVDKKQLRHMLFNQDRKYVNCYFAPAQCLLQI